MAAAGFMRCYGVGSTDPAREVRLPEVGPDSDSNGRPGSRWNPPIMRHGREHCSCPREPLVLDFGEELQQRIAILSTDLASGGTQLIQPALFSGGRLQRNLRG